MGALSLASQGKTLDILPTALGLLLALGLSGCGSPKEDLSTAVQATSPPWFTDVTRETGLDFVHDPGPTGSYFMPQIMGSGAALFDFDNDGRLDIYLLQNAGPESGSTNRLYRQGSDGRFTDVSKGSGLDIAGFNMGVAIADVNNDGWPDVLLTQYGGLRLFLNNGNGTFTDVSKEAGLDSPLWGTSACFFDYDRDGWLDLIVVDYVDYDGAVCPAVDGRQEYCNPKVFGGSVPKLYRNLGTTHGRGVRGEGRERKDQKSALAPRPSPLIPRFEDVTLKAGLGRFASSGLGVVCADFDGDHWPDIFVANDVRPNWLFLNQHDGTFKEEAVSRGLAYNAMGRAQANMGIALGDVNGDGLFDLFITHLAEETNTLWVQGPRGMFQDRTAAAGLTQTSWRGTGFGTVLADFDQDGALDLAIVNGRVSRPPPDSYASGFFWEPYAELNQLLIGDGQGRFRDLSLQNSPFCGTAGVYRGLACGDIDGDGALDLLVTETGGPARLYRNTVAGRGHWLLVRALDPALHRDAYGAEITVEAGGRRWTRWLNPGYSYLCSNDVRAHFGLGSNEKIARVLVLWPDGAEEEFPGGKANRVMVLHKGQGKKLRQAR
jgi:hypothetical protein